jgi:hypothetical protein
MMLGGFPFGAYFEDVLTPTEPSTGKPILVLGLDTYAISAESHESYAFLAEEKNTYAVLATERI